MAMIVGATSAYERDTPGTGNRLVMSLGGDGNVGIGITAPEAKLHVSDGALLLDNNQGLFFKSTTGAGKRVLLSDASNILHVGAGGPTGFDEMRFDVSTSGEVMTIKANGNVGVGTIGPNAKFQVVGGDAAITTQGNGLILRATDGPLCYRVKVNNVGQLSTIGVACP